MTKIKLIKFLVLVFVFLQCCTFGSLAAETTRKVADQETKAKKEFQSFYFLAEQKQNKKEKNERSELNKRLFQAIRQGKVELVKELLIKGASAKAKLDINATLHTPLTYALSCEMIDFCGEPDEIVRTKSIVKLLIESGADVNSKTLPFGDSPLRLASVRIGFEEIVEMLIKAGADVNEEKDGQTVLFGVLTPKTIKILLRNGLSPNHRDKEGRTPLHYLLGMMPREISDNENLETQYAEAVKALVQGGANVNLKIQTEPNSNGLPLCIARFKYAEKVAEVLRQLGAKGDCE